MHSCRYGRVKPATNADFWQTKRLANKTRDKKNIAQLKKLGWKILIIWECQIKHPEDLQKSLRSFLAS